MNSVKLGLLCCMGLWGHAGAMESVVNPPVSPGGREAKPLTADQAADQDFLQNTFLPATQGKKSFSIQDVSSQRLAKILLYLGRVERIERPSVFNSYQQVFFKQSLDGEEYKQYNPKLDELCKQAQEGKLLKTLDGMPLECGQKYQKSGT